MQNKNILLICGGGGKEHEVSLVTANFFLGQLEKIDNINPLFVEIKKDGNRIDGQGNPCELRKDGILVLFPGDPIKEESIRLNFAIPCFHGYPGETGDIQSLFEMMGLPYLGTGPEGSRICFNKITTKFWLNSLNIPNTPFCFLYDKSGSSYKMAENFFQQHNDIFVKAAMQGSSVGTYHVTKIEELIPKIEQAFGYSDYVLLEKTIKGRELEVAVFEYNGEIISTDPGEILCEADYYDYEEKYSETSGTKTAIKAPNLTEDTKEQIKQYSRRAFKALGLRHLTRIDYFLSQDGEVILNEANTFPGHTPISLFPSMMEEQGIPYFKFLQYIIQKESRK